MPTHTFTDAENIPQGLLKGDYPFEVVGVAFSISTGAKTKGSEVIEVKCLFYEDVKFEKKLAQWTENLILTDKCAWVVDTFTKSANLLVDGKPPVKGQAIEFDEAMLMGLRGWATCRSHYGKMNDGKGNMVEDRSKEYNEVVSWITNKPKLAKAAEDNF